MKEYKTVVDRETGELKKVEIGAEAIQPQGAVSKEDLEKLEGMSKRQLITLVERMARQCGLVATMSEEETAQAMLDTLAHTALKPVLSSISLKADIDARLKAVDKWLDRTQGKAIQRIDQRVMSINGHSAGEMSTSELIEALKAVKELPAGVKLLEDGRLDIVDVEYEETIDQ